MSVCRSGPAATAYYDAEFEVGWHFHPDSWRQSLASGAARGALGWPFAHGLEEIFAVDRPVNAASLAWCRRIGMTQLGRTTTYYDAELERSAPRPDGRPGPDPGRGPDPRRRKRCT